jgi:branched-chain amino acid transport system permease protein
LTTKVSPEPPDASDWRQQVARHLRALPGVALVGRAMRRAQSTPLCASRRRNVIETLAFVVVIGAGIGAALSGTTYRVQLGIDVGMFVMMAYSWNIISGFTGYVSFGQSAFFGFGAYAGAELIIKAGLPWYFTPLIAAGMAGVFAVPLGMIMLRLRGIYFALGMFGLVAVFRLISSKWAFTGSGSGLVIPGELAQTKIFLYMIGGVVLAFGINAFMSRSRFGLRAMSVRDDEEAASAMGVPTTRIKVGAYVLSAILPAFAGALVAYNISFIDASSTFDPNIDVETILYALAGGMGTLWGPLIGAVGLQLIGEQLWLNYPSFELGLLGALIIVVLLFMPGGVVSVLNRFGMVRRAIVKAPRVLPSPAELGRRQRGPRGDKPIIAGAAVDDGAPPAQQTAAAAGDQTEEVLAVRGVGVNFGGVQALDGVDLSVKRGETVCIIGANGAGKTTLFNAITGLVKPSAGEIHFNGVDIAKHSTTALARRGLGRTFQIPRPFESMTVWENVYLAALGGRRRSDAPAQAAWVVHTLDLEKIWLAPVDSLPVGYRRLVELGRALALQPDLILLDEVMAGMSQEELEQVRDAIRKMPSFGVGAVAGIEHVIRAIIDIADRIVVLDEGQKIAEGPPEEIMRDPEVVRAYLGEDMLAR